MDDTCRLADAITAANTDDAVGGCVAGAGADVIVLSADVTLDAELPRITSEMTIQGSGYTISGGFQFQIFIVETGELELNEVTLSNGYAGWGGAISNEAVLRISDTVFSGNFADYQGGAVYSEGELYISNSVFRDNYAGYGGAIHASYLTRIESSTFARNEAEFGGGAIVNDRTDLTSRNLPEMDISSSVFRDNRAGWGGAVLADYIMRISGSAFERNSAGEGGAIYSWGLLEAELRNSTFVHNVADQEGGAIYADGITGDDDVLTLVHVTLANNSASSGSSIFLTPDPATSVSIFGSIIVSKDSRNCTGDIARGAGNIVSDASCGAAHIGDPMLGDIVRPEDGSPAYYSLLFGSLAIDAAGSDHCPDTDQIGTPRPQGAACDIGAIEFVPEE